jgi:hypothetical protein
MPVAIYCGSGASAGSSGIPYWQGSAAKFKAKKAFRIPPAQAAFSSRGITSWLSI